MAKINKKKVQVEEFNTNDEEESVDASDDNNGSKAMQVDELKIVDERNKSDKAASNIENNQGCIIRMSVIIV